MSGPRSKAESRRTVMGLKSYWKDSLGVEFTSVMFPYGQYLKNISGIPWGFSFMPFKPFPSAIPRRSLSSISLLARCSSCEAFINPYSDCRQTWWSCSLCGHQNGYPKDETRYKEFSKLTALDEVRNRFCEFEIGIAKKCTGHRPLVCCLVDVSLLENIDAFGRALSGILDGVGDDMDMCLLTFGSLVGVFDLANAVPHIKEMDPHNQHNRLEEVVPLRSFFVRVGDYRDKLTRIAKNFGMIHASANSHIGNLPNEQKRTLGAAVRLLVGAIERSGRSLGGRIVAFISGRTTDSSTATTGTSYTSHARELAGLGISFDLYCVNPAGGVEFGLEELKMLPRLTGGRIYMYETPGQCALLSQDVYRRFTRKRVLNCVVRVRTSPEMRVAHAYGHFVPEERDNGVIYVAGGDERTTFYFDFDYNDIDGLESNEEPSVQVVVSFNETFGSKGGQTSIRRILRIMTIQSMIAEHTSQLYSSSDAAVITSLLAQKLIKATLVDSVSDARTLLTNWVVYLLTSFNEHSNRGKKVLVQLKYPMEHLVLFTFSLLKSDLLNAVASDDRRCYTQEAVMDLNPANIIKFIYPVLAGFVTPNILKKSSLHMTSVTFSTEDVPIFVLQTRRTVFIMSRQGVEVPKDIPVKCLINDWIAKMNAASDYTLELIFFTGGEIHSINNLVGAFLLEDGNSTGGSFVQYLDHIRNEVEIQIEE